MTAKTTQFDLICRACGNNHQSTRPKAARCRACIDSETKVVPAVCPQCTADTSKALLNGDTGTCPQCTESGTGSGMRHPITETEERRLRRRRNLQTSAKHQAKALAALGEKPIGSGFHRIRKGYRMSTPLQILWIELVHTCGAANCLLTDTTHEQDTKLRMVTIYHRLRIRKFSNHRLIYLDIAKLLRQTDSELEEAFKLLDEAGTPKKEAEEYSSFDDDDDDETTRMRSDVVNFAEAARRKRIREQLYLAEITKPLTTSKTKEKTNG